MLLRLAKPTTTTVLRRLATPLHHHPFSTTTTTTSDDNWNDAWETAWLPTDSSPWDPPAIPGDADADGDTTAFIADMKDNWEDRRGGRKGNKKSKQLSSKVVEDPTESGASGLERVKKMEYRVRKQRVHAALWLKEIDKLHESKLGVPNDTHHIDLLLHSCSEIFDSATNHVTEFKNKPHGWESMTKSQDGTVWEMSQREEDILLQEFERRMSFCKFQIASFIKTHIFSRRRPIDGWKYMIEVIGPNAKKGKGSVSRLPSLADPATQAFTEDREPTADGAARGHLTSPRRR
ncbi:hypothetical protein vseg_002067 [Gypsophila vaccaria]